MRDKQFRNLNSKREQRVVPVLKNFREYLSLQNGQVLRNGKIEDLNIYHLLVGDIIQVNVGEQFPVDGILLKGFSKLIIENFYSLQTLDLLVDESSITGESDLIKKNPFDCHGDEKVAPFLVSGSKVMEGTGFMLVCTVGVNTQLGKSKLKLQEEPEITPLQLKLESVVDQISDVGKYCAYGTFLGMTIHLVIEKLFFSTVINLFD